jgi:hypothetical protein
VPDLVNYFLRLPFERRLPHEQQITHDPETPNVNLVVVLLLDELRREKQRIFDAVPKRFVRQTPFREGLRIGQKIRNFHVNFLRFEIVVENEYFRRIYVFVHDSLLMQVINTRQNFFDDVSDDFFVDIVFVLLNEIENIFFGTVIMHNENVVIVLENVKNFNDIRTVQTNQHFNLSLAQKNRIFLLVNDSHAL